MLVSFNKKDVVLFISLFLYILVLMLWLFYDNSILYYQWLFNIKIYNLYFYFGIDGISLFFIYLISFLIPLCLLSLYNNKKNSTITFLSLLGLELLLMFVFISLDFLLFYLFFEIILIPFFILIGIRGYRKRRIFASYLLFFYTFVGSLLMILSIIILYVLNETTNILILSFLFRSYTDNLILCVLLLISFAIKIPIIPFHIWLPEAHVEASTEGSVLLAGIILKIGFYGIIRFVYPICADVLYIFAPIISILAGLSILYRSYSTLIQIDLKRVIAYSSIAHMNICILGLFSFNVHAITGVFIILIGHAFIPGGLFFVIGFLYNRYNTKLLKYYTGLSMHMPIFTYFFIILILGNISFPGTSNFLGELLILVGLYKVNLLSSIYNVMIGIFICTLYSILMCNRILFGLPNNKSILVYKDLNLLEILILLPIIYHIFWIGLFPLSWLDIIHYNIYYLFL